MDDGAGLERWLSVAGRLPVVGLVELLHVGAVGSLGKQTLLIQQGQNTHRLNKKHNTKIATYL